MKRGRPMSKRYYTERLADSVERLLAATTEKNGTFRADSDEMTNLIEAYQEWSAHVPLTREG